MSDFEAILETGAAAGVELAASKLAERGTPPGKCPNCEAPMIGAYCAVCGQERDTHRRTLKTLLHDLFEDILSFDSRILRTARALLFQPGELACAFRAGRTRRYVPAVRLYFFVSLIFFVMLGITNLAILQLQVIATPVKVVYDAKGNAYLPNPAYDPDDPALKNIPKLRPISKEKAAEPGGHFSYSTEVHFFSPIGAHHAEVSKAALARLKQVEVRVGVDDAGSQTRKNGPKAKAPKNWVETHLYTGIQNLAADPAALNEPLTTWMPRILFLLLPVYALLLAAFYWRQRKSYYFVDHLIFSLGVHSFTFVALIASAALAQLLPGQAVFWFLLASIGVYVFLALKRFYAQGWFWTSVKFVVLSGVYTLFFLLPALGGILALSFLYA